MNKKEMYINIFKLVKYENGKNGMLSSAYRIPYPTWVRVHLCHLP